MPYTTYIDQYEAPMLVGHPGICTAWPYALWRHCTCVRV